MSLLDSILTWATAALAPWQRDAMRRLFQKQQLDQQDYDDLYAMLKSARGLSDSQNRQPVPLAQEHLPAQVANAATIVLRAMRDLKDVNRIALGQKLEFAPRGITVVYGDNGSGKSGYSRVLKRVCRTRDVSETVHPDALDPKATFNIPEVTFDIEVGGNTRSLGWNETLHHPMNYLPSLYLTADVLGPTWIRNTMRPTYHTGWTSWRILGDKSYLH